MRVIEPDIHRRAALRRDHVGGRVACVNRGALQAGRVKMLRALIQLMRRQPGNQPRHDRHRVQRPVRIGRMALLAPYREKRGHGAAPPDLDHLAHHLRACGLADQAICHHLALGVHPVQKRACAVGGLALLVAGDGKHHCPLGRGVPHKIYGCGGKGGNAGFHIRGTAPIEEPVADHCAKGIDAPRVQIAHRHHIRMAVEAKTAIGPPRPPAGV